MKITAIQTNVIEPPLGLSPKPERSRSHVSSSREEAFSALSSWVFSYAQHKKMLAEDGKAARREADDAYALADNLYRVSEGEEIEVSPTRIEETEDRTVITFYLLFAPFEWHLEIADV